VLLKVYTPYMLNRYARESENPAQETSKKLILILSLTIGVMPGVFRVFLAEFIINPELRTGSRNGVYNRCNPFSGLCVSWIRLKRVLFH